LGAENIEGLKDLLGLNTSKKKIGEIRESRARFAVVFWAQKT
jgi:hypothetical protein